MASAAVLRNVKHPARPIAFHSPFDDFEISILANFFSRYWPLYRSDPNSFSQVVFSHLVSILRTNIACSYQVEKSGMKWTEPELQDVSDLFAHFCTLPPGLLQGYDNIAHRAALLDKLFGAETHGTPFSFVQPRISHCLFCPDEKLLVKATTTRAGGKAPGGYCWGYDMSSGASNVVLCKGTCCNCGSVYSLQTYTPGDEILQSIGVPYCQHRFIGAS